MKLPEFERAVLKLAFETDAKITTATVAYYLGIPSREANQLLNQLLEDGLLELDSDGSGNLFYKVANHDSDVQIKPLENYDSGLTLTEEISEASARQTGSNPVPTVAASRMTATPESDESGELIVISGPPAIPAKVEISPNYPATATQGLMKAPQRNFNIISTRSAEPDGSLGTLSPFVVSDEVRCDPRPIPQQKLVMTSCDNYSPPPVENPWFQQVPTDALVEYQENALVDYDLHQPEHQPGMALLLSLILCGTGQIYNGEVSKGITMMVLCFLLWFVLLGWVVHIWSIVDAVVVAERINRRPE